MIWFDKWRVRRLQSRADRLLRVITRITDKISALKARIRQAGE